MTFELGLGEWGEKSHCEQRNSSCRGRKGPWPPDNEWWVQEKVHLSRAVELLSSASQPLSCCLLGFTSSLQDLKVGSLSDGVGLPVWGSYVLSSWDMAGFQEAGFLYEVTHPGLVIHAWEEDDASLGITSLKRHSCRNEWNALETDLMPLIPRFRFLPKGWVQNKSRKFHSVSVLGCQQLSKGKCSWSCCLTSEVAKLNPLL